MSAQVNLRKEIGEVDGRLIKVWYKPPTLSELIERQLECENPSAVPQHPRDQPALY